MPSTLHPASNCRAPLAPKSNTGSVGVEARTLALPLTLYRPALDEVKMMSTLLDIYPDLAGIPAEYIRARLSLSTPFMIAALRATQTAEIQGGLPEKLEITMNEIVSAACPTHMLAIHSDTPLTFGQKRQISLYPCHDLVMRIYCTRLHKLPPLETRRCWFTLLSLLCQCAFPHRGPSRCYMRTFTRRIRGRSPRLRLPQLVVHATEVHGLWRNACALGVISPLLYDVIEESWAKTLTAMRACS
ncbi:hypothetical protein B0H14DRAFT_1711731 [Mycena olivaceomarginata]|nr:hypothetical protein B0H14DRAFT_1711731 [Mycena olivaceomarginata]